MDSLFAKLIVFISLLLGFVTGSLYIDSSISSISLDYNEGDEYPVLYNLDIENIGPERAKFDISSDVSWIFVYKDYEPVRKSIDMSPGNVVRFIVEIHPEQAPDGVHEKSVTVIARHPLVTTELYETRVFEVNINKNVVAATVSPELIEDPAPTEQPLSTIEPTPTLLISKTPTPTPTPTDEPSAGARKSIWFWFWNFIRGKLF